MSEVALEELQRRQSFALSPSLFPSPFVQPVLTLSQRHDRDRMMVMLYSNSHWKGGSLPPHNFYRTRPAKHKAELRMVHMMLSIRSKLAWFRKVLKASVRANLLTELVDPALGALTTKQAGYVMDELAWAARERESLGGMERSGVDGVWLADGPEGGGDSGVSAALRAAYLEQIVPLESVALEDVDWHPGSNEQVRNLVHPSLHCLIAGHTRVTPRPFVREQALAMMGTGHVKLSAIDEAAHLRIQAKTELASNWSRDYAWLPAEFCVSDQGAVYIESYINGLHPVRHAGLYDTLGQIFQVAVPLLERVLGELISPRPNRISHGNPTQGGHCPHRWWQDREDAEEEQRLWEADLAARGEAPGIKPLLSGQFFDQRRRKFLYPDCCGSFEPPPTVVPWSLRGRRLHVIVKLANIELTPGKPSYPGGKWHVEGMQNERIVASAIYYADEANITDSRLSFRQSVEAPSHYQQDDHEGVRGMYGLAQHAPLVQVLGSVRTSAGRMLCFPNILQHRVEPFALKDPSKPGHREIVVFFLVDPTQSAHVLSTSRVPPQQASWLRDSTECVHRAALLTHTSLAADAVDIVLSFLSDELGILTDAQARDHRLKLMQERTFFQDENTKEVFERPVSLCEH
jgi:hypothetical protein